MIKNYSGSANANENIGHHWLNVYDLNDRAKYAELIPTANHLIQKHCGQWWKNHPQSPEYNSCQHMVCRSLDMGHLLQEFIYQQLAADLKCPAIQLSNDPEFKYLSQSSN